MDKASLSYEQPPEPDPHSPQPFLRLRRKCFRLARKSAGHRHLALNPVFSVSVALSETLQLQG